MQVCFTEICRPCSRKGQVRDVLVFDNLGGLGS